jgi:tripartite-type tricarboxylate transporter receptor subunit TctC
VIVPFPAGGSLDTMTRELTQRMSKTLGQPFVVESRPGAGTMIASQAVARAAPDGYTLLSASVSFITSAYVFAKPLHNPLKDFAPVTQYATDAHIIVVNPQVLPVKTLGEMIAYAKANPGKITYGTAGISTAGHLSAEIFQQMAGVKFTHVPFNGSAPAIVNLVGGQIMMMFDAVSGHIPHLASGKLLGLAVTGSEQWSEGPQYPTVAQAGLPGFARNIWDGLLAPAGTPPEILNRLHQAAVEALKDPTLREAWTKRGINPLGSSPAEFARFLAQQAEQTSVVVRDLNMKLD